MTRLKKELKIKQDNRKEFLNTLSKKELIDVIMEREAEQPCISRGEGGEFTSEYLIKRRKYLMYSSKMKLVSLIIYSESDLEELKK